MDEDKVIEYLSRDLNFNLGEMFIKHMKDNVSIQESILRGLNELELHTLKLKELIEFTEMNVEYNPDKP